MPNKSKKIVIIGAGTGGTALAARLAKRGYNVEVYEKNDFNGGRCSLIHQNGHRFDQGPSLYLMPQVFEQTFSDLGKDIKDHINLLKCPKNYTVHFHDGQTCELSTDISKLCREVERFEGESEEVVQRFLAFVKEAHLHYQCSLKFALGTNYPTLMSLIKLEHLPIVFKLHILEKIYNRAKRFFKSDYMLKAFTFQTMYIGMSPYDSPATFSLLQGTEIIDGIWYPEGGFQRVIGALEDIAKEFGAKFNYSVPIKKIKIDSKSNEATGIVLEDGREIDADLVVCNADLVYAYNRLLPENSYGPKIGKQELTSSSISFYWGMKSIVSQLSTHNIFMAEEYKASFDRIFKDHTLPDEPSFYINVPSRIDPTAAPPGKDTLVVLVPCGHMSHDKQVDIDALVKTAREAVIRTIEKRTGIKNFRDLIDFELHNDPRVWQERFNLWHGSILGLAHSVPQVLWFRPGIKSHLYEKLFFVGASAHPGTGVPVVLSGAKLAEKEIVNYLEPGNMEFKETSSCCSLSFKTLLLSLLPLLLAFLFFNSMF